MISRFIIKNLRINHKSWFWLLFVVTSMLWSPNAPLALSASAQNNDTIVNATRSVVRIRAQKCDIVDCIDSGIGSGVIIQPDGFILTAWHVTVINEQDKSSSHLDRFVIEMPDNPGGIPKPKYRAELIADLPNQDLAFLQITADATGKSVTPVDLPFLPINTQKLEPDNKLMILGYPNPFIQNSPPTWHLIDKIVSNDIALEALDSLQEGYSGGPALIDERGELKVVGVVSSLDQNSAQLVHVKGLSELTQLRWTVDAGPTPSEPTSKESRVWCKKIAFLRLDVKGIPTLRITANLYAFNLVGQSGRLVAYAYDAKTHQPLKAANSKLPQALHGQLALHRDFGAQQYMDKLPVSIDVPLINLDLQTPTEQIEFRLVVLGNESQKLWEGEKWYSIKASNPGPVAAVNITPSPVTPPPVASAPITSTLPPPTAPPPSIPSGRIAFPIINKGKSDTGIYCFSTKKNCQRLSTMRQPDFSAGGYLVVNGDGGGRESLFRMGPNYEHQEPVSLHSEDGHPQWSPDGLNIVFDSTSFGKDNLSRIYWQEKTTGQPTEETPPILFGGVTLIGRAPVYLANWHVAYNGCDSWETWSHCGIYTVEHRGREKPIRITDNPNDIPTDGLGDRVLFMANRQANDWEIYVANWNEFNGITRLTNSPGCDGLATASPDGQYIAFMTNREGPWSVYVMRPDGSDQTKLFNIPEAGFGCGDAQWLDERMSWGP